MCSLIRRLKKQKSLLQLKFHILHSLDTGLPSLAASVAFLATARIMGSALQRMGRDSIAQKLRCEALGGSEVRCLGDRMERIAVSNKIVLGCLSPRHEVKANRVENILIFFPNSSRNLIIILLKEMWVTDNWEKQNETKH